MDKRESFKFSMRTIQNIQALIELGLARNKTEAIDLALEHMVTEETTKRLYRSTYAQTRSSTEFPQPEKADIPLTLMSLICGEKVRSYI